MKTATIQHLKQTLDNFDIKDLVEDEESNRENERFCKHVIHWESDTVTSSDKVEERTRDEKLLGNYIDSKIEGLPATQIQRHKDQTDSNKHERESTNAVDFKASGEVGPEVAKVSAKVGTEAGYHYERKEKDEDNERRDKGYALEEKMGGGDLAPHAKICQADAIGKHTKEYKVPIRARAEAKLAIKLKHSGANLAAGIAGGAGVGAGGGAGAGAGVGAIIGGLIGIVGGPPGAAIGAGVGAAIGGGAGAVAGGVGGGAGGGAIGYNFNFNLHVTAAEIFKHLSLEPVKEENGISDQGEGRLYIQPRGSPNKKLD